MSNVRLVVAIPSLNTWEADFGMSLVFMTNYLASHPLPGNVPVNYNIHNRKGSILPNSRQGMIDKAIEAEATHLLFIDSDQTFPRDIFHQLYARKKQVVACNIATKTIPANPTARYRDDTDAGQPVYTTTGSKGIEEVWRVGTGIMLIDLNIFKREKMPPRPWFTQTWVPELDSYRGEDWAFCEVLEEAGVKIYVDHDASKDVGHVGRLTYGHDLVVKS